MQYGSRNRRRLASVHTTHHHHPFVLQDYVKSATPKWQEHFDRVTGFWAEVAPLGHACGQLIMVNSLPMTSTPAKENGTRAALTLAIG